MSDGMMPTQGFTPTIGSISHMETMAKKTKAAGVFIILTICPAVFLTSCAG